jgi:hypothetical protein
MFGDYGYDIGTEMGKELDYLTKQNLSPQTSIIVYP